MKPLGVDCVLDLFSIFTSADKALLDFEVSRGDGWHSVKEANAPPRSPLYGTIEVLWDVSYLEISNWSLKSYCTNTDLT